MKHLLSAVFIGEILLLPILVTTLPFLDDSRRSAEEKRLLLSTIQIRNVTQFEMPQLRSVKRKALLGDSRSASLLIRIFDDCVKNSSRSEEHLGASRAACEEQAWFWEHVNAENGNPIAAEAEHDRLLRRGTCVDVYRARFWLNKTLKWRNVTPWKEASESLAGREKACGW